MREEKRIDEDWKRRAEEEKQRMEQTFQPKRGPAGAGATSKSAGRETADEESAPSAEDDEASAQYSAAGGGGGINFMTLISQLAGQAMMGLGQVEDPRTGQRTVDLALARDTIDLLGVLEEKTRGNLDAQESAVMEDVLYNLRMAFVNLSRAATRPPPEKPRS